MTSETPEPTYDYAEAKHRREWIDGLRLIANFFDANPQLKVPHYLIINVMCDTKEEVAAFAQAGSWTKEYTDNWFILRRQFGDITLDVNIYREEVCRKVEVGEKVIPAQPVQPQRTEKVYEWVCEDASLLGDPRRI